MSTEPTVPDLERLTGVRSGKRGYYREYLRSDQRLQQTVRALDSISRALVRTVEGPRALLHEIVRAAGGHLDAEWVVLGLADGALPRARPRFVAIDADGVMVEDEADLPHAVRLELGAVRAGLARTASTDASPWARVSMTLEGAPVGSLVVRHGPSIEPEPGDLSVLRILANQAAVSLHTSEQYQVGLDLHRRAQQLYDEATAQAVDLAARTNELRRTEQRLVAAHQREILDAERHRIARELHDSVSQLVLSAGMSVEIARGETASLGADGAGIVATLDQAKTFSQQAVSQLRDAIWSLHHSATTDAPVGLPELLSEMAQQYRPRLDVRLRVSGSAHASDPRTDHELARIAGEALFNVASHADARRADVRLTFAPTSLTLSVADDGSGDPATLRRLLRLESSSGAVTGHRGLRNMATRAESIGAALTFRRSRLGGVQVAVTLDDTRSVPAGRTHPTSRPPATTAPHDPSEDPS